MGRLELIVLGTAQDGGVPQIGCGCEHCRTARAAPRHARLAASLAVGCGSGDVHQAVLVDAGPDLRRQWDRWLLPGTALGAAFITHLHMGHIAGLLNWARRLWRQMRRPSIAPGRWLAFCALTARGRSSSAAVTSTFANSLRGKP